jgi:hypothetical protein
MSRVRLLPTTRLLPTLLLFPALFLLGCEPQGEETGSPGDAPGSGEPVAGVPIPTGAELVSQDAPRPDAVEQSYRVPGLASEELTAWYDERLPRGEGWEGWGWCEEEERGSRLHRFYFRPGTDRMLAVTVAAGDPPTLILAEDGSGPC